MLYPIFLIKLTISFQIDRRNFPGAFDRRITGIGPAGAGITERKDQESRIDQTCQKARSGKTSAPGNPGNGYLGLGQRAFNSHRIGQTDQTGPLGSGRNKIGASLI
jgi:hypothetical protein